jgi:hypothetical protein
MLFKTDGGRHVRRTLWITGAMFPNPSTGLNQSASVLSIASWARFLGMTGFSDWAAS